MPTISTFFGIVITMYFEDHNPPHFHARHGGHQAMYSISDLQLLEGFLPVKSHRRVLKWAEMYRDALMDDWNLAKGGNMPYPIPPLE